MMGQSDLAFCRFRYAEVLLNAAEAAWELGEKAKAADYLNEVRRRAASAKSNRTRSPDMRPSFGNVPPSSHSKDCVSTT